jgi:hypothetical protein
MIATNSQIMDEELLDQELQLNEENEIQDGDSFLLEELEGSMALISTLGKEFQPQADSTL